MIPKIPVTAHGDFSVCTPAVFIHKFHLNYRGFWFILEETEITKEQTI